MSSLEAANASVTDGSHGEQDLGPLAWVLDELRKSLDGTVKAMRRFVRDAEIARESDLASLDVGPLRIARQQLHQASGALDMVGMTSPALILRALESAVQKYVQRPELCTDDAANTIERASFALIAYLESVLSGKPVSAVSLFPQYREAQSLNGVERVHPADLWPVERRVREPEMPLTVPAQGYTAEARARLDNAVLRIIKGGGQGADAELLLLCQGFAAGESDRQARSFWKTCSAFFEALVAGLIEPDIYVKRVASRVLLQYASLAKGDRTIADRLVHELLFFCAQAGSPRGATARPATPALDAVREAFGLQRHQPVDYDVARFGLYDPAAMALARKRIGTAAETWSSLAGGDRNKLKPAADQFSLVCDSLRKLHPGSEPLAVALMNAVESTARSGEAPAPALAMEVATAVLYLQASLEELDAAREHMDERAQRLAQRLDGVVAGGESEPLESWMEELYRRVSDHQTMGSVVDELRVTLADAEKSMDQYFRTPEDVSVLNGVPGRLGQMRGVLSVLGLDQASHAVVHMRDTVERLIVGTVPEQERQPVFDKLGNSLGALGFLIDMLSYQRTMARKLFVYDDADGELKLVMGRVRPQHAAQDVPAEPPAPEFAPTAGQPLEAQPAAPQACAEPERPGLDLQLGDDAMAELDSAVSIPVEPIEPPASAPMPAPGEEDDELLQIFLEEAREVIGNGHAAIDALHRDPADLSEQTTLRRAFHTLKGSSRMVGLSDFGEAAWSMEQVLNAWLAEQKPVQPDLLTLSGDSLNAFARWVDDISSGAAGNWNPQMFQTAADAMRTQGRLVPLGLAQDIQAGDGAAVDFAETQPFELNAAELEGLQETAAPALEVSEAQDIDFSEFEQAREESLADVARQEEPQREVHVANLEPHELPSLSLDEIFTTNVLDRTIAARAEEGRLQAGEASPAEPPALDALPTEPIDPGQDVQVQPAGLADGLQVQELSEADFQAFESGSGPEAGADAFEFFAPHASDAEFVQEEDEREAKPGSGQVPAPEPEQELVSEQEQEAELPEPDTQRPGLEAADDSTKVIGSLRISLPLYNVYLGEAEEWSQRLIAELQGWLDDSDRPVPESAIARAHSLAGSSATVGFSGLSDMARLLEHALQHVQPQQYGVPAQLAVFQAVADDIRRLLHQFAAGFLKTPNPQLIGQLQDVLNAELVSGMAPLAALREESGQPASVAAPEPAAQAPQALDRVQRSHDEFDAVDVVDPDLFPIFEEEAIELLPQLGGALRQWSADPGNLAARSDLLRALHTLKGSARLAGAMRLGEMAHRMESDVEHIDKDAARSEEIEPLLVKLDTLQEAFEALRHPQAEPEWTAGQHEPAEPEAATALEEAPAAVEGPAPQLARPLTLQLAQGRAQAGQTVRVRAPLLDRLVNQAGEVLIARSRLDARMVQMRSSLTDLTGNLERLRQQLRDIEVQAETQMQSRLALSKDTAAGFDPLEFDRFTRVQELTRMMAESVNDVATVQRNLQRAMEGAEDDLVSQGRQARELQRDLLRTRMVEFDSISERLYALVRQSSKETGKQIKLDILGGMIEMDRGVLDRMTPAFEHLLRNCVGHGIESPDARLAAGKPASGSITIALRQEGNDVSVEFRDDGAGLNVVRIREKAVERGLIGADTPVTDVDAANLIFMPGFSTAAEVTGLSGRGIGMDVVRTEVNALGGRIETSSTVGQGSSFRLVLPLTTAVTQVVMLRAGGLSIGVPASLVSVVRRTTAQELASAYATQEFEEGNERLPFYWAGALLQSSPRSTEANAKIRPVVILQSAARRIAMHVDEVLGNQEVVVKNLGPQLSRMPGMAGMSVLASGAVVLIYNPVALATVYGDKVAEAAGAAVQPADADAPAVGAPAAPAALAQAAPQVPLVLVVDDSITVRRVTQRLLQREGYRVSLAADGLQALERLQEERPTVVLSDIEMPRMDGFDLARNIRSDARLKDLPVIMITSRIAEKHREHAMELGVNHYLGKPYSDEELLGLVQHYSILEAQAEAG